MSFVVKPDEFKLVCESCGSLTVVLPSDANPDPIKGLHAVVADRPAELFGCCAKGHYGQVPHLSS